MFGLLGQRRRWFLGSVLLGGALVLCSPLRCGVVCGGSMAPTLRSGQPFLLDRSAYQKQRVMRNDIVVFERNGTTYVKRVAAIAGETFYVLRFRDTDWETPVQVGELPRVRRLLKNFPALPAKLIRRQVPQGSCYVLGDASQCSEDSRNFGPIALEMVRGRLLMAATVAPANAWVAWVHAPVHL